MNDTRTDAELVAQWRQSVESCRAHYVGDWETTSLHIAAGELDRIVALAEKSLPVRVHDVERYYQDTDPDTGPLELGATDWMGDANG